MANTEELQTLVLTTLDRENVIADSKDLKTVVGENLNQLALLGVLNSLKSKEAIIIIIIITIIIITIIIIITVDKPGSFLAININI